MNIQLLRLSH